ncbi:hypothetical protein ColTof4_07822 [Colletotrichum tofieldiae]|nr:hypothetical protein ColTof3_02649 [Colletotrichum tofieldiae]GKT75399.1 hypothetical protein ColTof4_07822 [Colletotrichum tofieldiae]GKT83066.1 hypothetical protein Ct61P_00916 [Colletotrichum tofieldiae]
MVDGHVPRNWENGMNGRQILQFYVINFIKHDNPGLESNFEATRGHGGIKYHDTEPDDEEIDVYRKIMAKAKKEADTDEKKNAIEKRTKKETDEHGKPSNTLRDAETDSDGEHQTRNRFITEFEAQPEAVQNRLLKRVVNLLWDNEEDSIMAVLKQAIEETAGANKIDKQ